MNSTGSPLPCYGVLWVWRSNGVESMSEVERLAQALGKFPPFSHPAHFCYQQLAGEWKRVKRMRKRKCRGESVEYREPPYLYTSPPPITDFHVL